MRDCPPPSTATDISTCRIAPGEARATADADLVTTAMNALMGGPNPSETAAGLTSNIDNEPRTGRVAKVNHIKVDGDLVTIDFNRYFETAKTRPQTAQVVYTLTQLPGVGRVQFTVDGMPNGAIGANPLTRADIAEFLPAIFVESPAPGATVGHQFRVTGSAQTTPGTVGWHVDAPDGTQLVAGTAPVLGPAGARGPFLIPVTVPATATGAVTLVLFPPDQPTGADVVKIPLTLAAT
jgi:hypothetical protein